jgi:methanogenic corrinoid protein MtbC1
MDTDTKQKAITWLQEHRMALAKDAVARQYAMYGVRWEPYGKVGHEKSVRDMAYHLDYLVEAVAASDASLFTEYVGWVKVLFESLDFDETVVIHSLDCLREALTASEHDAALSPALAYLDAGREHAALVPATVPSFITGEHADLAQSYLDLLLVGDRQQAGKLILDAVEDGIAVKTVYLDVFQVAQREVGRLWQTNQITVAQEHFCTAATQLIMSQLYPYIFGSTRKDRRFVGTCVGGELHEMGVRMVADFFEMDGWDTYYLGANTPTDAILSTLEEQRVDVLGVSATMTFHVRQVAELIDAVRSSGIGNGTRILVGGYPFNISPTLWKELGADGCAANAEDAVRQANAWAS